MLPQEKYKNVFLGFGPEDKHTALECAIWALKCGVWWGLKYCTEPVDAPAVAPLTPAHIPVTQQADLQL